MYRNLKRIICVLIVLVMTAGVLPVLGEGYYFRELHELHEEQFSIFEPVEVFTSPRTGFGLDGFMTGDIGNTGRVTSADATLLARWLITPEAERDRL